MLHYTWKEYLTALTLLLIIYYGYVALRYFRSELKALIRRRDSAANFDTDHEPEIIDPFENHFHPVHDHPDDAEESYQQAEDLVARLKGVIAHAGFSDQQRPDLLDEIRELFEQYPQIDTPVLQGGITAMIVNECKNVGAVQLAAGEVEQLWAKVAS